MKFADIICFEAVKAGLTAEDKPSVVAELVACLVEAGAVQSPDHDGIVNAIMKREELGSTGIGKGVAVPHTKHPCVTRLFATVGVSFGGVDFDSLDGEKVHLFFLLVSPPDQRAEHLKALEYISKHLHNETFRTFLKQARTAGEIRQALEEFDH